MPLTAGTRLGPYEIQSAIGAGGMGEVYKARDTRLDRTVAVKILPSDVAKDPDFRIRFEQEARAVAALDHPNICGIYDVGSADGTHFLVMPHLDGQTLAARLEKGPLPLDQALKIAGEIADALDKAHRTGITHRDLKPGNIMLTRGGAKLLDFGLAKLKAPTGPISMSGMTRMATSGPGTAQGVILGTVQYMAPEQIEGREADARSDVWALGVVVYEMLTGTRPFSGESPASVIGAILRDAPPPVSARQPLAPAALDRAVAACLEKDPDDRWQSTADLKRQLGWVIGDAPSSALSTPTGRRRQTSLIVVPLVTALLGAATAWIVAGRPRDNIAPNDAAPVVFTVSAPPGMNLAGPAASTSVPQMAVSPDGRQLVFVVADAQGQQSLWVRAFDDPIARRLAGTDNAFDPFWSPDSRRIAFIAGGTLKSIGADGESPQTLARALVDPRGGSWGAAGDLLHYAGRTGTLSRHRLSGAPADDVTLDGLGVTR